MSCRVRAPATLSNLGPGFDVLGLALSEPFDLVEAAATAERGVRLVNVGPFGGRVPEDPERNVASWAAARVIEALGVSRGVELTVTKNIPPGSGLGSSAASSVGGAVAAMRALGGTLSEAALLAIGRDAEGLAAGSPHLDNVAPALLGGFVAVIGTNPPRVRPLKIPAHWHFAVILPHVEVRTAEARAVLPAKVPLADAIANLRHLTVVLDAAARDLLDDFAAHLQDHLALPYRSLLLPWLPAAIQAARNAGAPALQVSGSGPTIFAPCATPELAARVCAAVSEALVGAHLDSSTWVSRASAWGALGAAPAR